MPHKHRTDKTKTDLSFYDLPPSKIAQSLPVTNSSKTLPSKPSKHPTRKKRTENDTPRAFSRLLAPYRPPRSGLDDGLRPSKKLKISPPETAQAAPTPTQPLSIQHNEPLSAFNARVNAALPFTGITKKGGGDVKDIGKARQTKTERKMQRMQREWREEERRRQEKKGGEGDEKGVDEEGVEDMGVFGDEAGGGSGAGVGVGEKKGRKSKRKRRMGDGDGDEDDPWKALEVKRKEAGSGVNSGLVGLHDVVKAPPKFAKGVKRKEDIIRQARGEGGLKRQIELGDERQSVVERYRAMMKEKREGNV